MMSFGGFDQHTTAQPMADINTTPLVDVMLVLLIIFIVAAPLMTQSIQVELPKVAGKAVEPVEAVRLSINAQGNFTLNDQSLDMKTLQERLAVLATQTPQPEVHVLADKAVRYEHVAEVMATARTAGLSKIGFLLLPGGASE